MKRIVVSALVLVSAASFGMDTYKNYEKYLNLLSDEQSKLELSSEFAKMPLDEYEKFRHTLWNDIARFAPRPVPHNTSGQIKCGMCHEEVEPEEPFSLLECGHCYHAVCEKILFDSLHQLTRDGVCPIKTCSRPYKSEIFVRTQLLSFQSWLNQCRPWTPSESMIKKILAGMPYVIGAGVVCSIFYGVWKYRTHRKHRAATQKENTHILREL